MALILIMGHYGLMAGHMARTLRRAGHTPILAPDARSALQEALDLPDLILLDLDLSDLPGVELLRRLKDQPGTAQIPVLVLSGKPEIAAQLRGGDHGGVASILPKPVSGAQLCQAVDTALQDQRGEGAHALALARLRHGELIHHLILQGSDPLVFHVCRRLAADRTRNRGPSAAEALTWAEIAEWAKSEGLLDAQQARLLRRLPLLHLQKPLEGSAAGPQ